jgi:hypothetical protein
MAVEHDRARIAGERSVEAGLHMHRRAEAVRAVARGPRRGPAPAAQLTNESALSAWWRSHVTTAPWWRTTKRFAGPVLRATQTRRMRWFGIGVAAIAATLVLAAGGLWLLLASGPISLDIATPWLAAAIAENFGNEFRVDIGGTVLERDEHGRAAMRIRAITVRDRDGTVIASAPKAEVGFSSTSLLSGRPRAERLNLVGAELAIQVESDGKVTVSTGADQRPLATAPALDAVRSGPLAAASAADNDSSAEPKRGPQESFAAFLAWVDSLGAFGLDGGDLTEVGLKSGNLVVDDRRNGQQSRFENIHLSLTRPRAGALEFQLGSEDAARPWLLVASIRPGSDGARTVDLEARKILLKDLLLAMRVDGGQIETDAPISAMLRAEIAQDGTPQFASGRILVGPGSFVDAGDPAAKFAIDRAEMQLDWNAAQRALAMPFQIVSGGTRLTLNGRVEAPREANEGWAFNLGGGSVVLAPTSPNEEPLVLNRVLVRSRIDPVARRLDIEQAEVAGKGVGVAMSGNLDYSGPDPRLNIGVAARKLSLAAFKQMWPSVVTPAVRNWVIERAAGGMIEQGEIATNAPISTLRSGGPPVPDDGLSIQIQTSGATVRPFDNLPEIREADLVTRVKGRTATVTLGRGVVAMPSGRKLTVANGVFEVPDTSVKNPPAKVRARVEGPVAAAAELLSMDRLKEAAGVPVDPATSRGNVLATVNLALPLNTEVKSSTLTYSIAADIVNFSADHFLMSQRVEAQTLRASANNQGYQIKGDMRIGGAPASVELRRGTGEPDAEVRITGTLDDAARTRFGLDANGAIIGPIPIKVGGRVAFGGDLDSRLSIEADFTPTKLDNPFPGWTKAPNRPARATFTYVGRGKPIRLEDVAFDGNGASIRGNVEFDQNGDLATGTFPVFGLSDGDKTNLRLERTPDNLYKATVRGDTFDGRNFIKASMSGNAETKQRRPAIDIDIDAKLGAVAGFKGEVLRNLDFHLTRRGGTIRNLGVTARFAGEGALQGELRGRPNERQVVYIESTDAGALFRFTDTYSRMVGGQMWIAMDPPTHDGAKLDGLVDVREFAVRGESGLDGVVASAPNGARSGVQFSRMRVEFTRAPGKMSIHEGLVTGPMVGATIDGVMDYAANELHLRGTFVPLYGLNSAFGNIPILGFLLGGKEGLIGSMTYEVVGTPGAPVLRVNPISAVAPGFVRKFMEFPSSLPNDRFPAAANNRDR